MVVNAAIRVEVGKRALVLWLRRYISDVGNRFISVKTVNGRIKGLPSLKSIRSFSR